MGNIYCTNQSNSLTSILTGQISLQGGQQDIFHLIIKPKNIGNFSQKVYFSNKSICLLQGIVVVEQFQILGEEGQKLTGVNLGKIFIGQMKKYKLIAINNTQRHIETSFTSFNKQIQPGNFKLDSNKINFVIKSSPDQYAKQLKHTYCNLQYQKINIEPYKQIQNNILILRKPTKIQQKYIQNISYGKTEEQIQEKQTTQTIVIRNNFNQEIIKFPIKFISILPKVKLSSSVLNFQQIQQRSTSSQQLFIFNKSQRPISISFTLAQCYKIQGPQVLPPKKQTKIIVKLRKVTTGQINDIILLHLFNHYSIQIKVLGVCRSSSLNRRITYTQNSQYSHAPFNLNVNFKNNNFLQTKTTLKSSLSSRLRTDLLYSLRMQRTLRQKNNFIQKQNDIIVKQPFLHLKKQQNNLVLNEYLMRKTKNIFTKISKNQINKLCRPLQHQQMLKISVPERQIDFKHLFVNTQAEKQIKIINKNNFSIIFQWDFGIQTSLMKTNADPIKIQAHSQQNLPIIFKPDQLGSLCIPLVYTINKHHSFQINIIAYTTLLSVSTSQSNITIVINNPSKTDSFQQSQEIDVYNNGNTSLKCKIKFQQSQFFSTDCQNLLIQPLSSQKIKIYYRPNQLSEIGQERFDLDKLIIKVIDGIQTNIKCTGRVIGSKISICQKYIKFNQCLVSLAETGKITLKNNTKQEIVYGFNLPVQLQGLITFQKQTNSISGEQKRLVNFNILVHEQIQINSFIQLIVPHEKPLKIPIYLHFKYPEIKCINQSIDFGIVPILSYSDPFIFKIISSAKRQFKLQCSRKLQQQDYIIQIKQIKNKLFQNQQLFSRNNKKAKTNFILKQNVERKKINQKFIIKIVPGIQNCFQIKIYPKKVNLININLPFKNQNALKNNQAFSLSLKCQGIQSVLYLFPKKIKFDSMIFFQGKSNQIRNFQLKNPHEYWLQWKIQNYQQKNCFYLSEYKGKLKPFQQVLIQCIFKPTQQGIFSQKLTLNIKQSGKQIKDNKIVQIPFELYGQSILSTLKFSTNQVILPAVSLGIEAKTSFYIINQGYQVINVTKWKISNTFPININVNFPQGKMLSLGKNMIKVEVTVSSKLSVSFTTILQFYDEFGTRYDLPLSCTFDNSIFTTFVYLEKQKGINIIHDKKQNIIRIASSLPFSNQRGCDSSACQSVSCEFVRKWISFKLNIQINQFPNDLIQSNGDLLRKITNKLSGSQLLPEPIIDGQSNENSLLIYYSQCIKILKIQGAFLNQIRPQYLLSLKDFKNVTKNKDLLQNQYMFQNLSTQCWLILFYQLCKLYVMPQLSQKNIAKISKINTLALNSTVYSSSQLLVLRFFNNFNIKADQILLNLSDSMFFLQTLQKCMQKTFGINFNDTLKNLKMSIMTVNPPLFLNLISKSIYEHMAEYSLNLYLSQTDLFSIGPKQIILFMTSFINMIFCYSNVKNINFQASIGEKVTKIIQIQNPINKKIKYKVKLQGSSEFHYNYSDIYILPKNKTQLKITYFCRSNKQNQAKIYLVPIKDQQGSIYGQPLVFKLTTSILIKTQQQQTNLNSNIKQYKNSK